MIDKLYDNDLIRIGNCLWESAEDQDDERLRGYARAIWAISDFMKSGDAIVISDDHFELFSD